MDPRASIWWKAAGAITIIWLITLASMRWFHGRRITADRVAEHLRSQPLTHVSGAERQRRLLRTVELINRLPFEERRRLRLEGHLREWFNGLTDEEKKLVVEATMPTGLQQMTEAFNRMPREERRRLVERALEDLRREAARVRSDAMRVYERDPEWVQRIVDEGMRVYLTEASADAKIDLQPLVEQMQSILRGPMR